MALSPLNAKDKLLIIFPEPKDAALLFAITFILVRVYNWLLRSEIASGSDSSSPLCKRKENLFPDFFSPHQQRPGPTEQGGSVSHVMIIRLRQGSEVGPGSSLRAQPGKPERKPLKM